MASKPKEEQTISEQASVASDVATVKRSLRMSWFAEKKDHLTIGLNYEKTKDVAASSVALGQIIGAIFEIEERTFTTSDGEQTTQLMALGEFEAVKYSTGEVMETGAASLPRYYLEGIKAALGKGAAENAQFAVEIVLVPTGKQVPTAYEVRNLLPRAIDSPINRLKAQLQKHNRLRLPPPTAETVLLDAPAPIEGSAVEKSSDAA